MVAMARRDPARSIQIQELSESEQIPVKFLEQILLDLRRAELLWSKRGAGGGYQLNRAADQITLGEVVAQIDGPFVPLSCLSTPPGPGRCGCGKMLPCGLGQTFSELQEMTQDFLTRKTLAEVAASESQVSVSFDI
jgi:Rrf2 family protein